MSKKRLLVLGAGGHGCSIAEAASAGDVFDVVGFLDDFVSIGKIRVGIPVFGPIATILINRHRFDSIIIGIGDNSLREKIMVQLLRDGLKIANVVHPLAFVSPSAVLGIGSVVMCGAVIGTEAIVGVGAIINCGAVVDHHGVVEDFGHLGVNASMAGGTVVGQGGWMQAGSVLGCGARLPSRQILPPGRTLA